MRYYRTFFFAKYTRYTHTKSRLIYSVENGNCVFSPH